MEKNLPKIHRSPVIEKIECNCPLEDLFAHFARIPDTSFLNSSLETDAGRYSFIGIEPFLVLSGKDNNLQIRSDGRRLSIKSDPFKCLESLIRTYRTDNNTPLPFVAGGIGYLSYDLKDILERLPQRAKDDLDLPDIYFVFYRALLIHDRLEPRRLYISIVDIDPGGHKKTNELMKEIKEAVKAASGTIRPAPESVLHEPVFESNFSKTGYIRSVRKVIDYIRGGDIYQTCLSQRFKTEWPFHPYDLYLRLNKINPSPFSAYLNFERSRVISSSPELFLRLADNTVETRPMKGTRPRGKDAGDDIVLKERLEKSRKDEAELAMIVDLERNDLGKIGVPGSIEVAEHRRIETYPTVFQTISIVKSRVSGGISPVDIIKAAFPGGSISGCPKIRAMEIIDELEPTRRNVYTGSVGYISFHNTMDLNIAIRTMIMKGKDVYFQVGSGIVADSDPEAEYRETLDKARALMESLRVSACSCVP
ncbi:MAG: aminodeoxychorismate synthase component I [Candidatus Makaraimicrobium thalassicum]|nr:MAG: aminodeoxychorismate synthase component I [Candidatus Omnitrophota bacterium]